MVVTGNLRSRHLRLRLPGPINRPTVLPRRCRQSPRRKLHRCLLCLPRLVVHLHRCKQDHLQKVPPEILSNEQDNELTSQLPAWHRLLQRVPLTSTNRRRHPLSSKKSPTWRTPFRKTRKSQTLAPTTSKTWKSLPATIATNTFKLVTSPRKVTPLPNHPTIPNRPTTVFLRQAYPATSQVNNSPNQTPNKPPTTSLNHRLASTA